VTDIACWGLSNMLKIFGLKDLSNMLKIFGLKQKDKQCLLRPLKHAENIRFEKSDTHCLLRPVKHAEKIFGLKNVTDTAC
jgi:hypothetical protein